MRNHIVFLFFALALLGCSSDDNSGGENDPDESFLPQEQGKYWVYDVNSEDFSGRDSLYVSGTNISGGNTYYTYTTLETATGFYSSVMTSGQSRVSGARIMISGSINFGDVFGEELGDLGVVFEDFVFFDANATQGAALDSESGGFSIPYDDEIDLDVDYTLYSKAGQGFSSYTVPGGTVYQNVKAVTVAVSVVITAKMNFFGTDLSYPVLTTQDVISSTQYYAENVGMIYAATDIQYNLSEIPDIGFEIPVPENFYTHITEVLDDYLAE